MRQGSRVAVTSGESVPMAMALLRTPTVMRCGHTDRPGPPQPRGGSASRVHLSDIVHLRYEMFGQPCAQDRDAIGLHGGPISTKGVGKVVDDVGQATLAVEALPEEPGGGVEHQAC